MSSGFSMHLLAKACALLVFLAMGPVAGCADIGVTGVTGGTGGAGGAGLAVACTDSATVNTNLLDWKLTVSVGPIESGKPFAATLGGSALFDAGFLDAMQDLPDLWPDGVREVDLVDLKATVHVRSGATGPDVVLRLEPIPYKCSIDKSLCDSANDLPSVPGLRGNSDCEPQADFNPCGRFIDLPISTDCDPGGICDGLEKAGPGSQCVRNGFCVTGDQLLPLQEATEHYTAASEGKVFFGWDDESTGATLEEEGLNKGTWNLPPAVYEEETGPNGLRVTVRGIPAALECTMGVNCVLGVECTEARAKPTPSSELVSFPIQTEPP